MRCLTSFSISKRSWPPQYRCTDGQFRAVV
ncbi:MAG TPA: hypothetical protein DEF77_03785 [Gammaproteobacteria bacterium]|nr:hypothetical protein [Gammaproteobacteria bacterium]